MADPTPYNLEIYMKPDIEYADCPEEERCQLELIKNENEYGEPISLGDVAGQENTKTLSVGMLKTGGGCDYRLNIGMVGGLPAEYLEVVHYYNYILIRGFFDIARGQWLNIQDIESLPGSPAKPSTTTAIIDWNDPEYSVFNTWFNYNFRAATPAVSYSYGWTDNGTGTWAGWNVLDPDYPYLNDVEGDYPEHRHFHARYISTFGDGGYQEILCDNVEINNGPENETYDAGTRNLYQAFFRDEIAISTLTDNVTGQSSEMRFTMLGTVHTDVTLSGSCGSCYEGYEETTNRVQIYMDGVLSSSNTITGRLDFVGDGSTETCTGDRVVYGVSNPGYIDIWRPTVAAGEIYVCYLGGYTMTDMGKSADYPGAVCRLIYDGWTDCSWGISINSTEDQLAKPLYAPVIKKVEDITVYNGSNASILEMADGGGLTAKNNALKAALDQFYDKVYEVHITNGGSNASALGLRAGAYKIWKGAEVEE